MRVCSITKKYALMSSSLKFRQTNTFLENETLTTEHPEVLEVGLVTGEYFIWSLVQPFAEIETIGCMTRDVDGFGPKVVRRLELRHHAWSLPHPSTSDSSSLRHHFVKGCMVQNIDA